MLDFIWPPSANFYAIRVLDHSLPDLGLPYLEKIVVSVRPWINIGGCRSASTALETQFARPRLRAGKIPATTGSPGHLVEARSVLIAPTRLPFASNVSFSAEAARAGARTGRLIAEGAGGATLFHLIRKCCLTATARGQDPGGVVLLKRALSAQLGVLVAPLPGSREAAILFLREQTGNTSPRPEALQTLYGFTPAEAEIAVRLAAGADPEEIAAGKGITMNTLRTHLKSIMSKADVHRQGELVALILKGVSPLDRA